MKKLISTVLIAFASTMFANLVMDSALSAIGGTVPGVISDYKTKTKEAEKPAFFYVRFAAAESDLARMDSIVPGLGIGYRRIAGDGAADISISGIGYAERKKSRIFWTAPKASYIHYLHPDLKQSLYMGGGLAWGGLDAKHQRFIGIIPSLTGGYEFARKTTILGFTELNLSQPAFAVYKEGAFPGPIVECTVGIGF